MSLFTSDTGAGQPPCERCHKPDFVRLVSRGEKFAIWDCVRCGPVEQKKETAPRGGRSRNRSRDPVSHLISFDAESPF